MNEFLTQIALIDPIGLLLTAIAGGVIGYLFRDWDIERKDILFVIVFFIPFMFARAFWVVAVSGAVGSGLIGFIFFFAYLIPSYIVRRLTRL